MKKIVLFIFLLFMFGCSPSPSERAKMEQSQQDTISITPTPHKSLVYDTIVVKSKKTTQIVRPSDIIRESYKGVEPRLFVDDDKPRQITREKRVLKVVPNIEKTSISIKGRLNYVMSDTMEVGQPSVVEVSISRNMTKKQVVNTVSTFRRFNNTISEVVDTIIRVTPVMIVKLQEVGTKGNFQIDTITPMKQVVELEDTSFTVWQWKVTPLKDGIKTLTLSVDLVINGVEKNLTIYDGHIYVHMKHKFWVVIWTFISTYWQWLCTAAIFPLLIWLFKMFIFPKLKKKNTR